MFPRLCHGLVTHAAHADLISANNPEVQQGRPCAVVNGVQLEPDTQPQASLPMSRSLEPVLLLIPLGSHKKLQTSTASTYTTLLSVKKQQRPDQN